MKAVLDRKVPKSPCETPVFTESSHRPTRRSPHPEVPARHRPRRLAQAPVTVTEPLVPEPVPESSTEAGTNTSPALLDLNDPAIIAGLNQQAAVLRNMLFPTQVIDALALGENASAVGVRLFLARFREEAGGSGDAVENVLLDQLTLAHLKVGEFYALAAESPNFDFKQAYNNAAVRLLGAICTLISTLTVYRNSARPSQVGRAAQAHGAKLVNQSANVSSSFSIEAELHTQQGSTGSRRRR